MGERASHHFRVEVPNLLDDLGLSVYAVRLYLRLKRVAGDSGRCYYSTRELAAHCGMGAGSVSKAKRELVEARLIEVRRGGCYARDSVRIVDVWSANYARFTESSLEMGNEAVQEMNSSVQEVNESVQEVNDSVRVMNNSVHEVNTKEEPVKEEPGKEEPRTAPATQTKQARGKEVQIKEVPLRGEGGSLFGAICEVLGWDWRTLAARERGKVAQTVGILGKAGYSEEDLRAFMREVWFRDWRWVKYGQRPTMAQLRQEIGKLRCGAVKGEVRDGRDDGGGGRGGERVGGWRGSGESGREERARGEMDRGEINEEVRQRLEQHRAKRRAEGSLYFR